MNELFLKKYHSLVHGNNIFHIANYCFFWNTKSWGSYSKDILYSPSTFWKSLAKYIYCASSKVSIGYGSIKWSLRGNALSPTRTQGKSILVFRRKDNLSRLSDFYSNAIPKWLLANILPSLFSLSPMLTKINL